MGSNTIYREVLLKNKLLVLQTITSHLSCEGDGPSVEPLM